MFTRPPPPSGQPPRYAVGRYFRANLRPVIIVIGLISAAYAFLWAGSAFSSIGSDKSAAGLGGLVAFDVALGILYIVVGVIELLGIFGAVRQSSSIAKRYFQLSLLVSVMVLAAEILRLIIHFKFKDLLIKNCETVVTTGSGDDNIFGTHHGSDLTPEQASDYCNDTWSHNTFSDIAWLLVSTFCSLLFASIAYSYYRQLLDPTVGVARPRPQDNVPLDTFRNYGEYNAYAQGTGLGYDAGGRSSPRPQSEYAPPYEPSKLPGYGGGYAGDVDPDKKVSDEDKALAGVSH